MITSRRLLKNYIISLITYLCEINSRTKRVFQGTQIVLAHTLDFSTLESMATLYFALLDFIVELRH